MLKTSWASPTIALAFACIGVGEDLPAALIRKLGDHVGGRGSLGPCFRAVTLKRVYLVLGTLLDEAT